MSRDKPLNSSQTLPSVFNPNPRQQMNGTKVVLLCVVVCSVYSRLFIIKSCFSICYLLINNAYSGYCRCGWARSCLMTERSRFVSCFWADEFVYTAKRRWNSGKHLRRSSVRWKSKLLLVVLVFA